jgi:signal transduction histidine kinase
VLPLLHTALLVLSSKNGEDGSAQREEASNLITVAHRTISDLIRSMPPPLSREVSRRGLIGALHQMIEGEIGDQFDSVAWHVDSEAEERASSVPELASEVLFYAAREAIRNAARYGRNGDPNRPLRLDLLVRWRDGLEVAVEDDGVGPDATTPVSGGSGQGLALHSTMLAVLGGTLVVERTQEARTRVVAALPEDCLAPASR